MATLVDEQAYLHQLDSRQVHVTTGPYLDKVNSHTVPYEMDIFGQSITVLPGVMSPQHDWAGWHMIDCLPQDFSGKDVLEIGSGSGLVSVFVGLRGARSIICADINPTAIENTQINLGRYPFNSQVFLSDVFSALPEKQYDAIIFNLPYHDGVPENDLEKGVIDAGYAAMRQFIANARSWLKDGGKLFVGFSQSGNVPVFLEELEKNGLKIERFWERNTYDEVERFRGPDFHYNCQVYQLSYES